MLVMKRSTSPNRKRHRFLLPPLAVTRAIDPSKYWRRKRTTEMYPKLWLNGFVSVFYWDPKESSKMLASIEDLVQEEKGQNRGRT